MPLVCDLNEPEQVRTAVAQLRAEFGPINVVVNNAAVMPAGVLHETMLEDWDRVFAVNVRGTYLVSREVIPDMIASGGAASFIWPPSLVCWDCRGLLPTAPPKAR